MERWQWVRALSAVGEHSDINKSYKEKRSVSDQVPEMEEELAGRHGHVPTVPATREAELA